MTYELFDVATDVDAWLAGPAQALAGFNVTAPHKEVVFRAIDRHTPTAARLRAVNTVRREGDAWVGHNTDLVGFARLLGTVPTRALVLGAGGAARAVATWLVDQGAAVTIAARRPDRAEALLADLGLPGAVVPFGGVAALLPTFECVVECAGSTEAAALPWARLPTGGRVITLSYGAGARPLLQAVGAAGRLAGDGLPMLVEQGRAAFSWWTGSTLSDEVTAAALAAARDV